MSLLFFISSFRILFCFLFRYNSNNLLDKTTTLYNADMLTLQTNNYFGTFKYETVDPSESEFTFYYTRVFLFLSRKILKIYIISQNNFDLLPSDGTTSFV